MYESKIYIVAPTGQRNIKSGKCFAEILAVFKLGHVDVLEDATDRYKPTNYFVYADDGDTEILEDNYGEELREINIDELIHELSLDMTTNYNNRVNALLSTLHAFRVLYGKNAIICLHYGY